MSNAAYLHLEEWQRLENHFNKASDFWKRQIVLRWLPERCHAREGDSLMNIEALIEAAEQAHTHTAEAKQVALDACARASVYLGKATEAETNTKQLLDLLRQLKEQRDRHEH